MTDILALACYAAGALAFGRFFFLAPRLRSERIGQPLTKLQQWFPWMPGQFTPVGEQLYRQMNVLMIVGWVFLMVGVLLSS